ncbi:MAG: hypothetical protein R6V13_11685 [Anaerolineae bacterium]
MIKEEMSIWTSADATEVKGLEQKVSGSNATDGIRFRGAAIENKVSITVSSGKRRQENAI